MISVVTTCKGRLEHLKQTLPLAAAEFPEKNVLVDYFCPDHSGEWVRANFPNYDICTLMYSQTGSSRFHKTAALNSGAQIAAMHGAEWLCFIDADMRVLPGLRAELERVINMGPRSIGVIGDETERIGFLFVSLEAFAAVDGYDEGFIGWGCEDLDMRLRLCVDAECKPVLLNRDLLNPIHHDNELRITFQDGTIRQSLVRNRHLLYQHIAARETEISPELRELLKHDGSTML